MPNMPNLATQSLATLILGKPAHSMLGRSASSTGIIAPKLYGRFVYGEQYIPDSIVPTLLTKMPELEWLRWRSPLRYGRIARASIKMMNTEIERLEQLVGVDG